MEIALMVAGVGVVACADLLSRSKLFYYAAAAVVAVLGMSLLFTFYIPDGLKTMWAIASATTHVAAAYFSWFTRVVPREYLVAYVVGAATVGVAIAHLHLKETDLDKTAFADVAFASLLLVGLATSWWSLREVDAVARNVVVAFAFCLAILSSWRRARSERVRGESSSSSTSDEEEEERHEAKKYATRRDWDDADTTREEMLRLSQHPAFQAWLSENSHRIRVLKS